MTSVERLNAPIPQESRLWKAPPVEPASLEASASGTDQGADKDATPGQEPGAPNSPEAPMVVSEVTVDPEWPQHGALVYTNASARYRPGLPLVLHGLSLSIKAGQRIGEKLRIRPSSLFATLTLDLLFEPGGLALLDDPCSRHHQLGPCACLFACVFL